MYNENRILFGYGTVLVGADARTLTFTIIRPPQKLGKTLHSNKQIANENIEIIYQVGVTCDVTELISLKNQLKNNDWNVNKEFEIKGYILDFSNYNEESVNVLLNKIDQAIRCQLWTCAC